MTPQEMTAQYTKVYKLHPIDDFWIIVGDCLREGMSESDAMEWADNLVLERFTEALSR